ncbi:uncharacterized protein LOC135843504 [Planococcus citri]|uniref:uncharacterized protein LOC135843504 n=1 Tax=Planococcus citri TaxID=170843 RepID=UPI0031F81A31
MNILFGTMFLATFWIEMQCLPKDPNPMCDVKQTKHHTLLANCSLLTTDVNIVPRDLSSEIEEMIISTQYINASEISNDLFKHYVKLKRLELSDIWGKRDNQSSLLMVFHEDAFSKLEKLEKLTIHKVKFDKNADFIWPPNLKRLELTIVELQQLVNTKSLTNLEYLDLSNNKLEQFPKLNEKAYKLDTIILKDNPIAMITVEQVAPYCLLTTLDLALTKEANFTKTGVDFCPCLRLLNWLKKKVPSSEGIKLECGSIGSGANAIQLGNSQCPNSTTFTEKELKLYSDCTSTSGNPADSPLWELLLYAVLFSVLFPIGYFANEAYNRYSARSEDASHVSHNTGKRLKRRLAAHCKESYECETECEEDCVETEQDET